MFSLLGSNGALSRICNVLIVMICNVLILKITSFQITIHLVFAYVS